MYAEGSRINIQRHPRVSPKSIEILQTMTFAQIGSGGILYKLKVFGSLEAAIPFCVERFSNPLSRNFGESSSA